MSTGPRDAVAMARIDAAQQQYQDYKEKYERLRSDVTIKLKFLEENKVSWASLQCHSLKSEKYTQTNLLNVAMFVSQVKVMHKQLLLFHNAISAYFAGNQQQLEQTLKQFNIKLKPPGADKPSWLEEQWDICWTSCRLLLYHHLHLFPVETPNLQRTTTEGNLQIIWWLNIWEESVGWWLDRWIAGYYCWMS